MQALVSASIAVAVPHDGVQSALRFAAREAVLRSSPVIIVGPEEPGHPGSAPAFLSRAAVDVEVMAGPGIPVDVLAQRDADAEAVLSACPDVCLVVVHRSNILHLMQALSYGAAGSRALVDIACVPTGWIPLVDDVRPVAIAIDDPLHARAALTEGLAQARIHRTSLRVVHAWDLPSEIEPTESAILASLWSSELRSRLRRQLCEISDGVACDIDVRRGVAADIVLDAARQSQLLVLGRNAGLATHGRHLGRTTRTAVRESPCPVVLLADRRESSS